MEWSFIGRFNVARQQDSIEGNTNILPHLESSWMYACILHCILQQVYILGWLKK